MLMRSIAILYSMYFLVWPSVNNAFAVRTPQNRYPVGYNPDDRTRPVYFPSIELQPKPTWPPLRNTSWQPPEGYVPTQECKNKHCAHCDTCPDKTKWQPPTGYVPPAYRRARNLRGGNNMETVPWADDHTDDPHDARIKLCTGMWMGKVILDKRCVYLD